MARGMCMGPGIHILCLILFLGACVGPVTAEFSYVDVVMNSAGTIQKNLQLQKKLAPLLHSEEFWNWTQQLNSRHALLRMAAFSAEDNFASYNRTEFKETSEKDLGLLDLIGHLFVNSSLLNSGMPSSLSSQSYDDAIGQLLKSLLSSFQSTTTVIRNNTDEGSPSPANDLIQSPRYNGGLSESLTNILNSVLQKNNMSPSDAIFQQIKGAIENSNASESCKEDAFRVSDGLQTQQPWALRMFDASAKIPTDLLNLNIFWTGSYDECYSDSTVAASFLHPKTLLSPVKPHFCTVLVNLPFAFGAGGGGAFDASKLKIDTCLPKSCSSQDTKVLANLVLGAIPSVQNFSLAASSAYCQPTPEEVPYETKDKVMMCLLSMLGLIAVAGTAYEVIVMEFIPKFKKNQKHETPDDPNFSNLDKIESSMETPYILRHANGGSPESTQKQNVKENINDDTLKPKNGDTKEKRSVVAKILLAFSVYSNGKRILSTAQPKGSLKAVNGIRFLSMSWVILGHSIAFSLQYTSNVPNYASEFLQRTSASAINNALVSVDTFFVLSGLLTSYLLLKEMKKSKGHINWFLFYFHRYWRLTPIYMIMIGIYATLFNHMIFGPARPPPDTSCDRKWWMNLLYINNFVEKTEDLCLAWSWYLNNDMQFYVLSPLLIVPLFYKELIGVIISVAFLLGVTITSGVISYNYKLPPSTLGGGDPNTDPTYFMTSYYIRPYCRMGPYVCGVLTGYILHKTKGKYQINTYVNLLCWAIAASCASAVLYGLSGAFRGEHLLSVEESAVYNALHRSVWGAAVCWVIFACATGNGGFINTLLSWSVFVPLSRLTYAAYLVHLIVMNVFNLSRTRPFYMTDFAQVYLFLGHLFVSYAVAFVTSLLFESPFMALEKIIFPSRSRK